MSHTLALSRMPLVECSSVQVYLLPHIPVEEIAENQKSQNNLSHEKMKEVTRG